MLAHSSHVIKSSQPVLHELFRMCYTEAVSQQQTPTCAALVPVVCSKGPCVTSSVNGAQQTQRALPVYTPETQAMISPSTVPALHMSHVPLSLLWFSSVEQ